MIQKSYGKTSNQWTTYIYSLHFTLQYIGASQHWCESTFSYGELYYIIVFTFVVIPIWLFQINTVYKFIIFNFHFTSHKQYKSNDFLQLLWQRRACHTTYNQCTFWNRILHYLLNFIDFFWFKEKRKMCTNFFTFAVFFMNCKCSHFWKHVMMTVVA